MTDAEKGTTGSGTGAPDEARSEPASGVSITYRARQAAPAEAPSVPEEPVATPRVLEAPVTQAVQPDGASARYAVIATGGKQYRVKVGDRIQVERLPAEAGSDVTLDEVLLLGGTGSTRIGTPIVNGASVTAHVDEHGRGEKIVVFKFKAKKGYRRRTGHRQELTRLTITAISG